MIDLCYIKCVFNKKKSNQISLHDIEILSSCNTTFHFNVRKKNEKSRCSFIKEIPLFNLLMNFNVVLTIPTLNKKKKKSKTKPKLTLCGECGR